MQKILKYRMLPFLPHIYILFLSSGKSSPTTPLHLFKLLEAKLERAVGTIIIISFMVKQIQKSQG